MYSSSQTMPAIVTTKMYWYRYRGIPTTTCNKRLLAKFLMRHKYVSKLGVYNALTLSRRGSKESHSVTPVRFLILVDEDPVFEIRVPLPIQGMIYITVQHPPPPPPPAPLCETYGSAVLSTGPQMEGTYDIN